MDLVGIVSFEAPGTETGPRTFALLALLNGVETAALTERQLPSLTVRGPAASVPLRIPASRLGPGDHRVTVALVDAQGDDPAADRPPFAAQSLTYDVVVGSPRPPKIAVFSPVPAEVINGVGALPPFVAADPASTYLRTRHEVGGGLYAKIGTGTRPVAHFVAVIVNGRQRDWAPGQRGMMRVDTAPDAGVVQLLPLAGLAPGVHQVAIFTIPDLDRSFFERREAAGGSRTFLVTVT